jgi:uncharacterized protein
MRARRTRPNGRFTRLTEVSLRPDVALTNGASPGSRYPRGMARVALRNLRLRPGEEHRETVSVPIEPLRFGGETYTSAPTEVAAELVVQRATSGDVFRLRFHTRLDGPCMRCLSPAGVEIDVDAQEYEASDARGDDELRSEYVVDGELDVGAWARDLVALTVPAQIRCRPDCAGLCPVCGSDLNLEPHDHPEAPADPRWAALEAFRNEPDD